MTSKQNSVHYTGFPITLDHCYYNAIVMQNKTIDKHCQCCSTRLLFTFYN